jgi:hypothetical protein
VIANVKMIHGTFSHILDFFFRQTPICYIEIIVIECQTILTKGSSRPVKFWIDPF